MIENISLLTEPRPETTSLPKTSMTARPPKSTLKSKNVCIHSRRTSVRLEPAMWSALVEIANKENCSVHDLCSAVHDTKETESSFTAALRSFMIEYYRSTQYAGGVITAMKIRINENKNGKL